MNTTLAQQLDFFYEKHGYGEEGGINNDWIWLKFRYFSLPIPNLKGRRENVWRHDMLHILLDYDTSWRGEAKVAGWVMGSGGWGNFYVAWLFALSMFSVGMIFFPLATFQGFVRGRHSRSPYLLGIQKSTLFQGSINDLKREFLFDKSDFKTTSKDIAIFGRWILVVFVWISLPILAFFLFFYLLNNIL
ncbi:MAG: hypothetical protein U5N85_04425 [Arcicella sp.]|nr:hypothetical protein [Arcicella sp.]